MCYYIDKEIMQGVVIEIEYTIIIKNMSAIPSTDFNIINYIPEGFYLDADAQLISTPEITNGMYGWESKEGSELGLEDDSIYAVTNLNNTDLLRNTTIGSNGERYIRVGFSKMLSTDIEETVFKNSAEIIEYSNVLGRRMQQLETNQAQESKLQSVYIANKKEKDYGESQPVIIIPPTGVEITHDVIVFITSILIILAIVIITKFRIIKRT